MLFYAFHGNSPEERTLGQRFSVDLEVEADLSRAGQSDDLRDTVNYAHLYQAVREVMEGPSRNLLEALAEAVAARVLRDFPASSARVRVGKFSPPIPAAAVVTSVEVFRQRERA